MKNLKLVLLLFVTQLFFTFALQAQTSTMEVMKLDMSYQDCQFLDVDIYLGGSASYTASSTITFIVATVNFDVFDQLGNLIHSSPQFNANAVYTNGTPMAQQLALQQRLDLYHPSITGSLTSGGSYTVIANIYHVEVSGNITPAPMFFFVNSNQGNTCPSFPTALGPSTTPVCSQSFTFQYFKYDPIQATQHSVSLIQNGVPVTVQTLEFDFVVQGRSPHGTIYNWVITDLATGIPDPISQTSNVLNYEFAACGEYLIECEVVQPGAGCTVVLEPLMVLVESSVFCDNELGGDDGPWRLGEENAAGDISLFPNPIQSGEKLSLKSDHMDMQKVSLVNSFGKVVFSQNIEANQETISLSLPELSAGLYFVQVQADNQTVMQKLLIQ